MAGHDVSDGGLITCLLEMSFAGISGIKVNVSHKSESPVSILFAEEVGWVLEVGTKETQYVLKQFENLKVPAFLIGKSSGLGLTSQVRLRSIQFYIIFYFSTDMNLNYGYRSTYP